MRSIITTSAIVFLALVAIYLIWSVPTYHANYYTDIVDSLEDVNQDLRDSLKLCGK